MTFRINNRREESLLFGTVKAYLLLISVLVLTPLCPGILLIFGYYKAGYYKAFSYWLLLPIIYLVVTLYCCAKSMRGPTFIVLGICLNLPLTAYVIYSSVKGGELFLWHGICLAFVLSWVILCIVRSIDQNRLPARWEETVSGAVIGGLILVTVLGLMPLRVEPAPGEGVSVNTQLIRAASEGDAARVESLLARGADVESTDPAGQTPLVHAARGRHRDVLQLLLSRGANPNVYERRDEPRGPTPLWWAATDGDVIGVQALIDHGANVDATHDGGYTALMGAVRFPDVVRALLMGGANVRARTTDGKTALTIAESNPKLLSPPDLQSKSPNAKGQYNDPALIEAAQKRYDEVIRLLIDWGAQK
jgi:hypothetical protein